LVSISLAMAAKLTLLPDRLPPDPLPTAAAWLAEAWRLAVQPNPDAMVLATVDARGRPAARVVLCKEIVAAPGYLVFYTNYHSRKGREIAASPRGAAVLYWEGLHRQLRIEGPIVKALPAESDAYFASRDWQRRVGAWASHQSEPIESRERLLAAVREASARFGTPDALSSAAPASGAAGDFPVPRPPHWGGYRLWADTVELWVEGEYRIHDRARWTRELSPATEYEFTAGAWTATRLQP
jgi:pyridoxamine 5'-phosphate oxidase